MVFSEVAQGITRARQAAIDILEFLEKASFIIILLTTGLILAGFCNGSGAILAALSAHHRSFQVYCLLCMRHAEGVIPDQRLNARVNSLASA